MQKKFNTVIESLGVYLPSREVTTREVLEKCNTPLQFPLEKITGIKTRRMAGQEEFSIDLATEAIRKCFESSKYQPEDIDILICCNISKVDSTDCYSFEPGTAIQLRKKLGFSRSIVFDITNACAGMFTGVLIVDRLIKAGCIRRGMVVSGEYISHLTQTAQQEIDGFMDTRLACLTLGDAGAAIILEEGTDYSSGFNDIHLLTLGRYSPYCIARAADSGGWIMFTDSVNLTDAAIKSCAKHTLEVLNKTGWSPFDFQHLLMHQTSSLTLNSAKREINLQLSEPLDCNLINNLEERGNTASTSHFVALADEIARDRIHPGDKIVFSISASGLTVGTALYVFDDLPEKMRCNLKAIKQSVTAQPQQHPLSRIRIENVVARALHPGEKRDSMEILQQVSSKCLEQLHIESREIPLLMYAGIYRTDFIMEPAYAAILAGKLDMNASIADLEDTNGTLAFDVFNGAIGFLNACYIAQNMIASGAYSRAMIVASEVENNAERFPDRLLGIQEAASAIILGMSSDNSTGFSPILFNYRVESMNDYRSYTQKIDHLFRVHRELSDDLENHYLECIVPLVLQLLDNEKLEMNAIDWLVPPQISPAFVHKLAERLAIPIEKTVDLAKDGQDLFSSSVPFGLQYLSEGGRAKSGNKALVIAVGAGVQAGCAIYYF